MFFPDCILPGHAFLTVASLHAHHVSIATQATFEHFVWGSLNFFDGLNLLFSFPDLLVFMEPKVGKKKKLIALSLYVKTV